jgi:hypothetical protein
MNELKDAVLKKIQEGKVHMQPRWHFVLRTVLYAVGTALAALVAVYLMSFVLFILHRTGLLFAPGLGVRGLTFFITASPWLLFGLVGVFLFVLYLLVRHYAFSYRRPLVYSIVGVALFAGIGASAIYAMEVHERIEAFAERNKVPGMAPMYRAFGNKHPDGVTLGVITERIDSGFMMETGVDEEVRVLVNERTKVPRRMSRYDIDDAVLVFGDREGDTITAFGIRPVSGDPTFERPGMRGKKGVRGSMIHNPPMVVPAPKE